MDAQVARAKALLAKMSDGSVGGTDADQDELGELMDELAAAGVTVEFDLSEPDVASLREQFREGTYVQMAGAMGVVLKSASGDGPWADCVDLKLAKVERGPAIRTSLNLGDGKERTHLFIRKRVHLTELSMCAASPREVQELWERGAFENRRRKIGLPEDASEIECQLGELRQDPIMGMIPSPLQHVVRAAHGAACICAVTTEDLYETSQGDGCYKDLVPRGCFVDGWHADRRCAQLKQEDQERRQEYRSRGAIWVGHRFEVQQVRLRTDPNGCVQVANKLPRGIAKYLSAEYLDLVLQVRCVVALAGGRLKHEQLLAFACGYHGRVGVSSCISHHCDVDCFHLIAAQMDTAGSLIHVAHIWRKLQAGDRALGDSDGSLTVALLRYGEENDKLAELEIHRPALFDFRVSSGFGRK
jgi:hypothetical protein